METEYILAIIAVLALYLFITRSETFVSMATTASMPEESQLTEPTLKFPALLYPYTQHQGTARAVKPGEEVPLLEFNSQGVASFYYNSMKVFQGRNVLFRAYHKNQKKPSKAIAQPKNDIIYEFDQYLKEDPELRKKTVLGYMPGDTFDVKFTLQIL
jgi:hypothetical protein